MLTLLFIIFFFMVIGKLVSFAFKATWSIFKVVMYLVFLPLIVAGLAIGGFFACLVGTFILGLILGAPVCAVFTYLINKKSKEEAVPQSENFQQTVEVNNDDQQAM